MVLLIFLMVMELWLTRNSLFRFAHVHARIKSIVVLGVSGRKLYDSLVLVQCWSEGAIHLRILVDWYPRLA